MKVIDPVGVILRNPTARRIERRPLTSAGSNEVWCCDGHDKMNKYGMSIWGMRDKFSRKWLGLWVLPNTSNRYSEVTAYLWLSLVHELGGKRLAYVRTTANSKICWLQEFLFKHRPTVVPRPSLSTVWQMLSGKLRHISVSYTDNGF